MSVSRDNRVSVANVARFTNFIGAQPDEYLELAVFEASKRIHVAYLKPGELARVVEQGQRLREYMGTFIVPNALMSELRYRYDAGRLSYAHGGRALDKHVLARRVVYVDVDACPPVKGISATDDEQAAAREVWLQVAEWMVSTLGDSKAIASGCSGNGYYVLVAVEPVPNDPDVTKRLERLLKLLSRKFSVPERAVIDASVWNASRLMPFPGTWKCKGGDYPERPHRLVTFECDAEPTRVPLEALC